MNPGSGRDYILDEFRIKNTVGTVVTMPYGNMFHIGKVEVRIMNKIKNEKKLCLICMEEHEVDTVEVIETEIFKDEEVSFIATYEYCSNADEYLETEEMIKVNILAMKDAWLSI